MKVFQISGRALPMVFLPACLMPLALQASCPATGADVCQCNVPASPPDYTMQGILRSGAEAKFFFTNPAAWGGQAVVQRSEDLLSWTPLAPATLVPQGDQLLFSETRPGAPRQVFYRTQFTFTSYAPVRSGRWSEERTWGGFVPPTEGVALVVPQGVTLTLDRDIVASTVRVCGVLAAAPERDFALTARALMVHGERAMLSLGSAANPFTRKAVITLTGAESEENLMGMGTKVLGVMDGGLLSLHGEIRTPWTRLTVPAVPGQTQITVLAASGWRVGDEIVIAPRGATPGETERRVLTGVTGNVLTLSSPLAFYHNGELKTFDGQEVDMRAEVGLLTRNIVVQGDATSAATGFGGHLMVMHGGGAQMDGVELRALGQRNRLGRYPFHWHIAGNASGQYLRRSAVHGSLQRGIIVHRTQRVLVEGNVVFDTPGHNYGVEDPEAVENVFRDNLALENQTQVFTSPGLAEQGDNQVANFWIRSARNTFTGNHAAASQASGFWYDHVPDGPTAFSHNTAHSSYHRSVNNDFVRDAGLLVNNLSAGRLAFSDSLFYQNVNGVWPNQDGAQTFQRCQWVDHWHGPPMTIDAVANHTIMEDCLIVGRSGLLPATGQPEPGNLPPAFLLQYSGLAELRRPTFMNYDTGALLSANDIFTEWRAQFFLDRVRLVNTQAAARTLHGQTITSLLDASYGLPAGVYADAASPQLAGAGTSPVMTAGGFGMLRWPVLPSYAMLRVETPVQSPYSYSAPWHSGTDYAVRSDGLRFSEANVNGFRVICGGAFSYQLEQAPATGNFFLTLDNHAIPMLPGTSQTVQMTVPVASAPARVARLTELNEDTMPPQSSQFLNAAPTLSAHLAAPLTTYYYDVVTAQLTVLADAGWVAVLR